MLSSTESCSSKGKEQNQIKETPLLQTAALCLRIDIKYFGRYLCKFVWETGS